MDDSADSANPLRTGSAAEAPLPASKPLGFTAPSPSAVRDWFDTAADAVVPAPDGTVETARQAADAYARRAKAANTRRAYRAGVRAWCDWCEAHGLCPLPGRAADVGAFLADSHGRGLSANTIGLHRAAIRYLHRAAGCPVPTDDVCVSETIAGITRDAARKGIVPRKKVAATATILRRLMAPIGGDLRGLRDRAILLVGFAGALRRSELAAIRFEHLEKTDRGIRLTLPQTKGDQTDAVTVPLPYGDTELCPVHALEAWQLAAGFSEGPVFRRIWLPPRSKPSATGEPPCKLAVVSAIGRCRHRGGEPVVPLGRGARRGDGAPPQRPPLG